MRGWDDHDKNFNDVSFKKENLCWYGEPDVGGATAKIGPCYVILQRGHTVWVSRRGDLWKCNVGQVFPMSAGEKDGLEAVPEELFKSKMKLKYDSEKLQYVDASAELEDESQGPSGGPDAECRTASRILRSSDPDRLPSDV